MVVMENIVEQNKSIITGLLLMVNRPGISKLVEFLETSDYFTAPASTKYHGCYEGGLAEHSLNVFNLLVGKNDKYKLNLTSDTQIITALLHDACKINFYKKEMKNVLKGKKINSYGKEVNDWQEEEVYVVKDSNPLGHAEKSVIMTQNTFSLQIWRLP